MSDLVHSISLDGILEEHRRSRGDCTATVFGERKLTYSQLADRVIRLANALEDAGVDKGDRVLWLGQNHSGVMEATIAAGKLGAMMCPINWRQTPEEMAFIVEDLEPRVIIWQDFEMGEAARATLDGARHHAPLLLALDGDGDGSYEAFVSAGAGADRQRQIDPDLPALILYTAAFAGRPNGAMLSQSAIIWQSMMVVDVFDLSQQTVTLVSGPLFHVAMTQYMMGTFVIGGTNVFMRRWHGTEAAETIQRHHCSLAFLFHQTAQELANLNRDGRYDFTCLRSPSLSPEWDAMVTLAPRRHLMGYGQTEVMGIASFEYYGHGQATSVLGKSGPVIQIRIFDEDGNEMPQGTPGEIVMRGPTVMNGYWRRPELNARRHRDGWHRTGDLGKREVDGSLSFIGPKTRMIKSGAENIYPAEVESCLRQHAVVADCAVIGVPDDKWVQSVKAIVRLKPGSPASAEELIEHCRQHIASYKKPRAIEFVDAVPRLKSGEIDYARLDETFGGGGYPGVAARQR